MDVDKLANKIYKLVKAIKSQGTDRSQGFRYYGNLMMIGQTIEKHNQILQDLREDETYHHIDFEMLGDFMKDFHQLIFEMVQEGDKLKSGEIKQKCKNFLLGHKKEEFEWIVYSRLASIKFESRVYDMDFDFFKIIRLSLFDDNTMNILKELAREPIDNIPNKISFIRNWTDIYTMLSRKKEPKEELYYVRFKVVANNSVTATRRAREMIFQILAILCLMHHNSTRSGFFQEFGAHVGMHKHNTTLLIGKDHTSVTRLAKINEDFGSVAKITYSQELQQMIKKNFRAIPLFSKILSLESKNNLVERIIRSIYWYYEGYRTTNLNIRLSTLIFSLEGLFVPERNETKKGEVMSLRIMMFENLTEGHFRYPEEVYSMYNYRSEIVHGSERMEGYNIERYTRFSETNYIEKPIGSLLFRISRLLLAVLKYISDHDLDTIKDFIRSLYDGDNAVNCVDWITDYHDATGFGKFIENNRDRLINNRTH